MTIQVHNPFFFFFSFPLLTCRGDHSLLSIYDQIDPLLLFQESPPKVIWTPDLKFENIEHQSPL